MNEYVWVCVSLITHIRVGTCVCMCVCVCVVGGALVNVLLKINYTDTSWCQWVLLIQTMVLPLQGGPELFIDSNKTLYGVLFSTDAEISVFP